MIHGCFLFQAQVHLPLLETLFLALRMIGGTTNQQTKTQNTNRTRGLQMTISEVDLQAALLLTVRIFFFKSNVIPQPLMIHQEYFLKSLHTAL